MGSVSSVGFLQAQRKPGPFRLEIEWIKALRTVDDEVTGYRDSLKRRKNLVSSD
jgi:hypothetical protein